MNLFSGVNTRLYLIVFLPIVIFFILSYSLFHFYVQSIIAKDHHQRLEVSLTLEQTYLNDWFEEQRKTIRALSTVYNAYEGDSTEFASYLLRLINTEEEFESIAFSAFDGYILVDDSGHITRKTDTFPFSEKKSLFDLSTDGKVSVSLLLNEEHSSSSPLIFSIPLTPRNNNQDRDAEENGGVLLATIPIEKIENLLLSIHSPVQGEAYIVHRDGTFITNPSQLSPFIEDPERNNTPLLSEKLESTIIEKARRGEKITTPYENYAGTRVYGSYTPVFGGQWFLIGEASTQAIYERYSGYTSLLVILISVGTFILIPIIFRVTHTIVAPLRLLDREAQRMKSEQESTTNLEWERFREAPIELRNLAYSFFTMSERISRQVETLEQITVTDELTGLYNRKHLFEEGFRYIHLSHRTDTNLSCLMIDIDFFKDFNDTYGHSFGDKVLKEVGHTIVDSIRETDIAVRYGGEEFVVLAYNADKNQILRLAERLRKAVEEQHHLYEEKLERKESREGTESAGTTRNVQVTISIGAAVLRKSSEKMDTVSNVKEIFEDLLKRADEALYIAKERGRNRVELENRSKENRSK